MRRISNDEQCPKCLSRELNMRWEKKYVGEYTDVKFDQRPEFKEYLVIQCIRCSYMYQVFPSDWRGARDVY